MHELGIKKSFYGYTHGITTGDTPEGFYAGIYDDFNLDYTKTDTYWITHLLEPSQASYSLYGLESFDIYESKEAKSADCGRRVRMNKHVSQAWS